MEDQDSDLPHSPKSRPANLLRAGFDRLAALMRVRWLPVTTRRGRLARVALARLLGRDANLPPRPGAYTYPAWIADNGPDPAELDRQRAEPAGMNPPILFSIITPVYNPQASVLRETIESVLAQTYPHWELCLADGGSSPEVARVLAEYARQDGRIRVTTLAENLGISGNSNAALAMARGDYLLLMDHDDLLAPHLLYRVASVLAGSADIDLVYYDEDKVDADGLTRRDPFFKPDWSPEMLLSANYLTHAVLRRSLVEAVGPFDAQYDGTQDWDLALRAIEKARQVAHIPEVLYHWRQVGGSTAGEFNAKPWVFDRQLACLRAHLQRTGRPDGQARFERPGIVRVSWPVPAARVSIVIPNKDQPDLLRRCLDPLRSKSGSIELELIVVDSGSSDPLTLEYYAELAHDPRFRLEQFSGPFNFSAACNQGARAANGNLLLFLNNDIEGASEDWVEELARWALRPEIGVVGGKLLYPDGTIQHAGIVMGLSGHADHVFLGQPESSGGIYGSSDWYRNYLAVTGACLMLRADLFSRLGGFDERYRLVYSDVALCLAAVQAGFRNLYTPFARLIHHQGRSRGQFMPAADMDLAFHEFRPWLETGDPAFNPNLSYQAVNPGLASPQEENRVERLTRILAEISEASTGAEDDDPQPYAE